MQALLIRFTVRDVDTWERVFREEAGTRRANGSQTEFVFHNATKPEEIWMLLGWDDLFRAQLFVKSDDMIEALIRADIHEQPDVWFLEGEREIPP